MDSANQVRIREGRIHAFRPQIMTPAMIQNVLLEGFGKESEEYMDWLKSNTDLKQLAILRYGFTMKKEEINQHIVSEDMATVSERVKKHVTEKDNAFSAVVVGVEEPWEVCLLKLMVDVIRNSVPGNFRDLQRSRLLESDGGGMPKAVRKEIESDFAAAKKDRALIKPLGRKLHQYGVFDEYQDRFFALLNSGN